MVMLAGSMVMFYYGTLGMLTFSWSGGNLFAQAGHICMTLAVIYTVVEAVRQKRWKSWAAGLTFGFLLWIPFNINQFFYFVANPDLAKDLFSGNLMPPGFNQRRTMDRGQWRFVHGLSSVVHRPKVHGDRPTETI